MYISVTSWRNLLRTRAVGNSSEHGEFIPRPSFMFAKGKLFFYLLEGMFLAGVFVGTMLISHAEEETLQMLQTVLGGYVGQRQIQSFSSIALSTFVSLFSSLLVLFFCGLCTIAQPIVFLALLFKGLGYGFSLWKCCGAICIYPSDAYHLFWCSITDRCRKSFGQNVYPSVPFNASERRKNRT